jgi:hypothetical protein
MKWCTFWNKLVVIIRQGLDGSIRREAVVNASLLAENFGLLMREIKSKSAH